MKYFLKLHYILFFILCSQTVFAQNWSTERSVEAYATVDHTTPSITLKWNASSYATAYSIFRRDLDSSSWGSSIASLGPNDSTYIDLAIDVDHKYEYKILRSTSITEPFSQTGAKMEAYSFIASGIRIQAEHFRGNALVLLSKTASEIGASYIDQLYKDIAGDGYDLYYRVLDDTVDVQDVVQIIDSYEDLQLIYLLGQVPYPYSGLYCDKGPNYEYPPDGHNEDNGGHCGAWIADSYYGSYTEDWKDVDSLTIAKRDANDNEIGDGKFDNMQLPGPVVLQIGRVDLSRLTSFTENETELLQRYLDKVTNYKHAQSSYLREAIIENNFASFQEGFSSGAIRDFYAHLGPGLTTYADLFNTTASTDYLFSYTCGAGSYTSCSGVGITADFKTKNPALFNHMFGSYFGDYDINNNIGRASLAANKGGLISAWSGRPKWITHALALGENYGRAAQRTQNNNWDYGLSFYQNYAHITLLGDPSLRTSMFAPPTQLVLTTNGAKTNVDLDWTASVANGVVGYYIYWSKTPYSGYQLLNQIPVNGTSFTHYTPENGTNYYMVRAERLETTGSGSYYNLSIAAAESVSGITRTAGIREVQHEAFTIYPVPSALQITIRSKNTQVTTGQILNSSGQVVMKDIQILDGNSIDISALSKGVYFIKTTREVHRFIKI